MVQLAGQLFNTILDELCRTYDLADARAPTPAQLMFQVGNPGPYELPADYLRSQNGKQFYLYNGQPYFMTVCEQWEYDQLIQQPGFMDFPRDFMTDTTPNPPVEFVWPPPSISVPVTIRYFRMMPAIVSPETSNTVPWFSYTQYLLRRLAGEMMTVADDERAAKFLTDDERIDPQGAGVLLRKYLTLKDDPEGKAKTVELDRRRFGRSQWNNLPNTKTIGW